MKKLTTFLLSICFLFCFSVVSFASTEESTQPITTTEENVQIIDPEEENIQTINTPDPKSGIDDVRFRFAVTPPGLIPRFSWYDFKFVDQGDGSARLKHIYNGKIYEPHEINDTLIVMGQIEVRFIDNNGNVYWKKYYQSTNLRNFAADISSVKVRYGLDSIQIITRHRQQASITGPIYANLENENFVYDIAPGKGQLYKFTLERDGVYSEIVNQKRIPDGKYTIESTYRPKHFLYSGSGVSSVIGKSSAETTPQEWDIKFNKKYRAYEIKLGSLNLAWESLSGNNVITYYPTNGGVDQLWYFKDLGDGRYGIFSAKQKHRFLNFDQNDNNIIVADGRDVSQQSFKLRNVDIKPGHYTIESVSNPGYYVSTRKNFLPNEAFISTTAMHLRVTYDEYKDAYRIQVRDTAFPLTWEQKTGNYKNVTFPYITSKDNTYWDLIPVGNGNFYLRNREVPNYYLNVDSDGSNLSVAEARYNSNQQFRFTSVS